MNALLPGRETGDCTTEGNTKMQTGFIGLGHMGTGMAANLLKAGHEVSVYNRSPGKLLR